MRAAISMVGPFVTSPGLGIKSVKGCQTFLGRSHGPGWGVGGVLDHSVPLGMPAEQLWASSRWMS